MNLDQEERKLVLAAIDDGFSQALREAFASYLTNRAAALDEKVREELPDTPDRLFRYALEEAIYARDDARGIFAELTGKIVAVEDKKEKACL